MGLELARKERAAFLEGPVGAVCFARHVLVACPDPSLRVCVVWGRPNARDARDLLELLEVAFHPSMSPAIDALTDITTMVGLNPRAFYTLMTGLSQKRAAFAARIQRQAFVRRPGLLGSVAAGLYDAVGETFPVRMFGETGAALAWLGRSDPALQSWLDAAVPCASLTERERQAAVLASQGRANKEIGDHMRVSTSTVSVLLLRASRKLGVKTRDALARALRF